MQWSDEKDRLTALIADRVSYEEIGRMYGVSGTAVRKAARRLGIRMEPRRKVNEKEHFNKGRGRKVSCIHCGKTFTMHNGSTGKYCSNKCQAEHQHEEYIKKWKDGDDVKSVRGALSISKHIRRYIMAKNECRCETCGWGMVNPYTGTVPLHIHHIDGDYKNNREDNLMLLCPNCHSLTENYGSRNRNCTRDREKYNTKHNTKEDTQ